MHLSGKYDLFLLLIKGIIPVTYTDATYLNGLVCVQNDADPP